MSQCPCQSGKTYKSCCEPFHKETARPPTAEALMRARYSAYSKHEIDFLGESLHPGHRKDYDPETTKGWAEKSTWTGLTIVSKDKGEESDSKGMVEFIAKFQFENEDKEHHEVAEFKKLEGRWYYVDGQVKGPKPVTREEPKVGRNDPCPCNSGKKYKKCCGAS